MFKRSVSYFMVGAFLFSFITSSSTGTRGPHDEDSEGSSPHTYHIQPSHFKKRNRDAPKKLTRIFLLQENELPSQDKKLVTGVSLLGTAATGTAVFALFGLGGSVLSLFFGPAPEGSGLLSKYLVVGTTATFLALPDAYLTYKKGVTNMVLWGQHAREEIDHTSFTSWFKKHIACRSASEVLESTIKGVFIGGGLIVLSGKALFALYETDMVNDNKEFTAVTMTGFTIYQIFRVEEMLRNAWLTISHFSHKKYRQWLRGDTSHDTRRHKLKESFAKGMRKILLSEDPNTPSSQRISLDGNIQDLYDVLANDHRTFKDQISVLQTQYASLKEASKTRVLSSDEVTSLKTLPQQIQELKALEVLVALKRLYTFGANDQDKETYAPQSTWKPMWWYAAMGLGVPTVGLAATCIWYGWRRVVNATYGDFVLDHNDDDAFTLPEATYDSLGTLLTLPYLGILLKVVSGVFAKKASLLMGYNPTLHDETIRDETVFRSGTKGIAHLVKGARSWFAGLPVALVGGTGMALNGIPLKKQWWTLIPNMIAAGCMEDIGSEPDLYELLDHLLKATEEEHQKQALATLLTRASRYLKHLGKEELVALEGFLQKPWETLFPEEEGEEGATGEAEREEGSDEGQGASGSSASDSSPQGSPPESAQGSPPRKDERRSFLAETTFDGAFGNPRTRAHTGESGVIVDSDSDDERIRPAPPRASEEAFCAPSFTPQKKKHKHKKKKKNPSRNTLTDLLLPEGSTEADDEDPEGKWITVSSRKKVRKKNLPPVLQFKKFG